MARNEGSEGKNTVGPRAAAEAAVSEAQLQAQLRAVARLTRELQTTSASLDGAKKQSAKDREEVIAMRAKVAELTSENKTTLAEAKASEDDMKKRLAKVQEAAAEEKKRSTKVLDQAAATRIGLMAEHEEKLKLAAAREGAVQKKLDEHKKMHIGVEDRVRAESKSKIEDLEATRQKLLSEADQFKLELNEKSSAIQKMQEDLAEANISLKDAAERERELDRTLANVQAMLAKEQEASATMGEAYEQQTVELNEVKAKLGEALAREEQTAKEAAMMDEDTKSSLNLLAKLRSDLEKVNGQLSAALAREQEASATASEQAKVVQEARRNLIRGERRVVDLEGDLEKAQALQKKTESEGTAARAQLEAELTATTGELMSVRDAQSDAEKSRASMAKKLGDVSDLLAAREAECVENRQIVHKTTSKMEQVQRTLDEANSREEKTRAELEEVRKLQEEAEVRAAEARNAVAALVLKEVRPTRTTHLAMRDTGAKEEAENQRLKAVLVRQEADKEIEDILKREEDLKKEVHRKKIEVAQVTLERDRAKSETEDARREIAEARREVAVIKQQDEESKLAAAKAAALVYTREAELQAGLEKCKAESEAKIATIVAQVKKETLDKVAMAEKKSAEKIEQVCSIYIIAYQLST